MNRVLNFIVAAVILFAVHVSAQPTYVITEGNDSLFSLQVNNTDVQNVRNVSIDSVIRAIRAIAPGDSITINPVIIQFGKGENNTLNIENRSLIIECFGDPMRYEMREFSHITLTGRITSRHSTSTVQLTSLVDRDGNAISKTTIVPVISSANITNTGTGQAFSNSNWNFDVTITGGTIEASKVAIASTFGMTIAGGTITSDSISVNNYNNGRLEITGGQLYGNIRNMGLYTSLTLSGSPKINDAISTNFSGQIKIDTSFVSSDKIPLILFESARSVGAVAVVGGAAHIGSFKFDDSQYALTVSGDDIVVSVSEKFIPPIYPRYVIIGGNGVDYRVIKDTVPLASEQNIMSFNNIIDRIIDDAAGWPCTLQFGSGDQILDFGAVPLYIDGSRTVRNRRWGDITLTGKITASAINLINDATVYNMADINGDVNMSQTSNFTNISGNISGVVSNSSYGTLTIFGGTIRSIEAMFNNRSYDGRGTTIIKGGAIGDTINAKSVAISIGFSNDLHISGTAHIFGYSRLITNYRDGTIRISGGTVSQLAHPTDSSRYSDYVISNEIHESNIIISGNAVISSVRAPTIKHLVGRLEILDSAEIFNSAENGLSIDLGRLKTVILGGNPTIHNPILIRYYLGYNTSLTLATDKNAFAPGDKIYKLTTNDDFDTSWIISTNGARFTRNFTFTAAPTATEEVALVVNGNDIVLTSSTVRTVRLNLNGGEGTVPATILVADGGKIGELAKPSTAGYSKAGYQHDGKWYISLGEVNGIITIGEEFIFGTGLLATEVTGNMTLALRWTSHNAVFDFERAIPETDINEEASVIIPVTVTAGEFTVGPNPVEKQSGVINIFRIGRRITDGVLTIYDASGNFVNRINIDDNSANNSGSRIVGSWDLTDVLGRTVPGGTYLIRGVVTTVSGNRERVSVLVGIR